MKSIVQKLDVETYVLCEKVAKAAGFDSVAAWISFLVDEKVGHTSFRLKGRAYLTAISLDAGPAAFVEVHPQGWREGI